MAADKKTNNPPEAGTKLIHRCKECNEVGSIYLDENNIYTNPHLKLELRVQAQICSNCGVTVYTPQDYGKIMQAEEHASGRPYVKVDVSKDGRISKYSLH